MRAIGQMLARFPAARALIAGALLTNLAAGEARAQNEETAMAVPRLAPHGSDGITLPRPLAAEQVARLRRAFNDQAHGRLQAAMGEDSGIDDGSRLGQAMLGQLLADRYLGRFTRPAAGELAAWLARWGELPDAPQIHALLLQRLPRGAIPPEAPLALSLPPDTVHDPAVEEITPDAPSVPRNPALDHDVHEQARAGRFAAAVRLIGAARGMTPAYAALLRAEVAQVLFTHNRDQEALDLASGAARLGEGRIGLADFIAGLAAWRLDRPARALAHFETASRAQLAPPTLHAAAAFWAARAHLRTHDPGGYVPWMQRAASQPRTFYGLLARRTLGIGIGAGFAWDRETLGPADLDAIAATPEGLAAFALLQIDQPARAEAMLRRLWVVSRGNVSLGRAVMLVAERAGLFDLAAQLAALIQSEDGRPRDYARFPVPHLLPRNGFLVDPPLLYALTRIESNFDSAEVSSAGAMGLMQLMPDTAAEISGNPALANLLSARLHEPALNLELGQRYVNYLAQRELVDNDLIRLLTCYNSGPGKFAEWGPSVMDRGDPLLFIEAIPTDETRGFVQRVLAYSWIYAARLHLPAPSLDELAAGAFPRFHAYDTPLAHAGLH